MKHIEHLQHDPRIGRGQPAPTKPSGDRTEVGMTITAQQDQLAVEHDTASTQRVAKHGELGKLARRIPPGPRAES
jgi:hypothetical protein